MDHDEHPTNLSFVDRHRAKYMSQEDPANFYFVAAVTIAAMVVMTLFIFCQGAFYNAWMGLWNRFPSLKKDGLTIKERLKKQGLNTFLLYLAMSNLCAAVFLSVAWYGFSIQTGESPMYPGQWKSFLAVYTGIMAADGALKPLRLGLAIALSNRSDATMLWVQNKTGSRKAAVSIAFAAIVIGTFGFMFLGVTSASVMSSVPIFVP